MICLMNGVIVRMVGARLVGVLTSNVELYENCRVERLDKNKD